MYKRGKAFSLIELMIVITIIGVLAAIAVPSYQLYIQKAKMAKVLSSLQVYENQLAENYTTIGTWPTVLYNGNQTITQNNFVATGNSDMPYIFYSAGLGLAGNPNKVYLWGGTSGGWDAKTALVITAVPSTDGSVSFYCGYWYYGHPDADLTFNMLPGGCSHENLANL